jgi:transcriptional regulator with XRE-family HTH domain
LDPIRCVDCGREFDLPTPDRSLERCADCAPQLGPGSHLLARFGDNLRRLRRSAGLGQSALAGAARIERSRLHRLEQAEAEPGTAPTLRLAQALAVPLERLLDGIYWNPGEVAPSPRRRRPRSARLAGFFLISRWGFDDLDSHPPPRLVETRLQAAEVFGQRLRAVRKRRHLSHRNLGEGAGFARSSLSRIEHGHRETTLSVALALARALEVAPEALLGGIEWRAPMRPARQQTPLAGVEAPSQDIDAGDGDREIVGAQIAVAIGEEVARHRRAAGLTLEQLGEASEVSRVHIHHLERGANAPLIGMLLKTAASLNLQPGRLTARIRWDPERNVFRLRARVPEPVAPLRVIGANIRGVRRRLGVSQAELATFAGMTRSEIAPFERGERNYRLSTALRVAGALGMSASEFFSGVVDWNVRPLPPPIAVDGPGGGIDGEDCSRGAEGRATAAGGRR